MSIVFGYALMSNGDTYAGDLRTVPMKWSYQGNLFAVAGRAPGTQRFVGSAANAEGTVLAITQGGDAYTFGTGGVVFQGNIPSIAGRLLGADEFATIGYNFNVGWFAVTLAGDLFAQWHCAWCYLGNILTNSPTSVPSQTWGGVKARYRPEGKALPSQDK